MRSSYQVRAYNIKHNCDIKEFLEAYRLLLQRAIDEVWARIKWIEEHDKRRRLIPIIPKDGAFKHHELRYMLLNEWHYSKHYVDSAIKQAYSIIKSWRRSYIKGERSRRKPTVRRKFVRIKGTLYSYRDGIIKVSIRPHEEYLKFDISKAWFLSRAKGEMGELVLNEKYLTITFREKVKETKAKGKIAWDFNERSLDGFNPKLGWIRIDLAKLYHIHRAYELKRRRLQMMASKKHSLKRVLIKYSRCERNRAKDLIHKLTTEISRKFNSYEHGLEALKKEAMFTRSKEHNRNIAKSDWKMIQTFMVYKAKVQILNPKNSTKRCSKCGMMNAPKGALYRCEHCGLRIDRQLNAAINLYLQMEGLSPSPKLFSELMKGWSGFTLTGEEADEGFDELMRSIRLVNTKGYVCLPKTT